MAYLFPKIKKEYLIPIFVVGILLVFASVVYAAATQYLCPVKTGGDFSASGHLRDCYKALYGQTTMVGTTTAPVAEWGTCANVTNNVSGGKDLFIPASTSVEWQRVYTTDTAIRPKSLPTGMSVAICGGGGSGGSSCSQTFESSYSYVACLTIRTAPSCKSTLGTQGNTASNPYAVGQQYNDQQIRNQIQQLSSSIWGATTKGNASTTLTSRGGTAGGQTFTYTNTTELDPDSIPGAKIYNDYTSFSGPTGAGACPLP